MAAHRKLEGRSPIWRAMTAILGVIALVVAMAVTGSSAYADNGSPTTQSDGGSAVSTDTSTPGTSTTDTSTTDTTGTDTLTTGAPTTETTAPTTPPSEVPPPTDTTGQTTTPVAPTTDSVRFSAVNEKGDPLGGAAFTISGAGGTTFCVSDNSATGAAAGCKGAKAVADEDPADGVFLVSGLPSDTYTVAAVTPPPGYELTDETKTVTLDGAGQPLRGVATAAFVRTGGTTPNDLGSFLFGAPAATYSATIKVHAGGIRTGTSTVNSLPDGAVFQAIPTTTGLTGGPWECTVSGGTCNITVPAKSSGGYKWTVSEKTAPVGWYLNPKLDYGDAFSGTPTDYAFTTSTVNNGTSVDVPGPSANSTYSDNTSNPGNPFSGLLSTSLNDPKVPTQCGINMALILDQSGSMAGTKETSLVSATHDVINALNGTPSNLAIYSFSAGNGGSGPGVGGKGSLPLTSLSTQSGADTANNWVDTNIKNPAGGTNWDQGIYQAVTPTKAYDLVVILTDGNPTTDHNGTGSGNNTRFANIENGIYSANALKALGTSVVAIGIGVSGGDENLVAISGQNGNNLKNGPFYYSGTNTSFATIFKNLATGNCQGQITVQKQIQDASGNLVSPNPSDANGWQFTGSISGSNTSIGSFAKTAQQNGTNGFTSAQVSIPVDATPTVTLAETPQSGYSLVSAQCTVDGKSVTTQVNGTAASFTATANVPINCTFVNKRNPEPAQVKVTKTWVINGTTYAPGATLPAGFSFTATPTVTGGSGTAPTAFGATGTGYKAGEKVTIGESAVTLGGAYAQCTNSAQTPTGQQTLAMGLNTFNVTNTVTCTRLTLVKKLQAGGTASATDWTLMASGGSPATVVSGVTGSDAVTSVRVPAGKYALSESGGSNLYELSSLMCNGTDVTTNKEVTLSQGIDMTCTFTNAPTPGSVTAVKSLPMIGGQSAKPGDPVSAGQVLGYSIVLTNTGGSAKSVTLTEHTPANATYTGSNGWSTADGGVTYTKTVSVPAATALGSGSVTVPFEVTVAASLPSGTLGFHNSVTPDGATCVSAADCVTDNPTPGVLHVIKALTMVNGGSVPADGVVNPGDTLTYTITVTNSGGTDASTTLTEHVPANTTLVSAPGWSGSGSTAGSAYTYDVTVVPGTPTSVSFTVTVDSDLAGAKSIDNAVTTSHEGECTVEDHQSSCETHNPTPATVVVTKTWAGTPTRGDQVQLSITEPDAEGPLATGQSTVGGAEGDKNAEADIVVGSLVSVDEVYTKASVAYSKSLACSYVDGEQGKQTVSLDGQSLVITPDMAGRTVTCTFTNTYNPPVPQPGPATLNIVKAASPGTTPIKPGDAFTYSLTVSNTSSETASSVHVSDPIPADIAITGTTASGWTCTVTGKDANGFGGTLACDLSGSLAGGVTAPVITLAATLSSTVTAVSVSNTGSVSWVNPDGSNGGPVSSTAVIGVIEVAGESSSVTPTSGTTSVEVLPTSQSVQPGKIAYTGVNTFGMTLLALLLLAGGALILGVGAMWRRKPRKH
ncbi:MAG: DUF11 domain-containing protein [Actinobacteria bacterium]|nr:DUF11 domain-containing protein [Actinomycetota bacterium]